MTTINTKLSIYGNVRINSFHNSKKNSSGAQPSDHWIKSVMMYPTEPNLVFACMSQTFRSSSCHALLNRLSPKVKWCMNNACQFKDPLGPVRTWRQQHRFLTLRPCRQRWVALSPMKLFTLDDRKKHIIVAKCERALSQASLVE